MGFNFFLFCSCFVVSFIISIPPDLLNSIDETVLHFIFNFVVVLFPSSSFFLVDPFYF